MRLLGSSLSTPSCPPPGWKKMRSPQGLWGRVTLPRGRMLPGNYDTGYQPNSSLEASQQPSRSPRTPLPPIDFIFGPGSWRPYPPRGVVTKGPADDGPLRPEARGGAPARLGPTLPSTLHSSLRTFSTVRDWFSIYCCPIEFFLKTLWCLSEPPLLTFYLMGIRFYFFF